VIQGSGSAAAALQKHYTLPAVAAAVIHYCFRARIPLPRQSTKSIEIVADGFQLTINTLVEVLRLHGELPAADAGAASAAEAEPVAAAALPVAATESEVAAPAESDAAPAAA